MVIRPPSARESGQTFAAVMFFGHSALRLLATVSRSSARPTDPIGTNAIAARVDLLRLVLSTRTAHPALTDQLPKFAGMNLRGMVYERPHRSTERLILAVDGVVVLEASTEGHGQADARRVCDSAKNV